MTPEERAAEVWAGAAPWRFLNPGMQRAIAAAIRAHGDAEIDRASQACRSYAQSQAVTDEGTRFTANYCADFISALRSDA